MARQLTAVDPPLSTREIETQHQELEDAVVRLEAEFAPQEEPAESFADESGKGRFPLHSRAADAERRAPLRRLLAVLADEPAGQRYEDEDDDFEDDEERPSRLPILIALAGVVLVVIGAGAYLYAERETVFSFLSSDDAQPEVAAATDTQLRRPPLRASPASRRRIPDRLINGTDTPPAEAPAPDTAAANTAPVEPAAPAPAPPSRGSWRRRPPPLPLESGLGDAATPQEPVGTSLVEQRAIYYYQGSEGQAGQASEGTATWAEITKDDRPAIQATLRSRGAT